MQEAHGTHSLPGTGPQRSSPGGTVIADTAWIAPHATIVGDVTIDDEASIWYGVAIRAEAEPIHIGRGSNIQDNSVVHTDPGAPAFIGVNVSIGHGAIVHGCTIEDGAL